MAINFDDDITARIARQRKQQMAASMGKTVEQMEQDSEYFDEIKAIEVQDKMDSEAARMMDAQGYMPPAKEPTVGGLEDLGRGALPVIQAESRMRGREFRENKTPSLSPETELTGESINPWNVNE